jgi:hypothetical protein
MQMTKATLRKFIIMLLAATALSGGLGTDAAYARGGGGFDRGGGGMAHVGTASAETTRVGGSTYPGFGRSHLGIGGGFGTTHAGGFGATGLGSLSIEHVRPAAEKNLGALAGARMPPGRIGLHYHDRRWLGDYAWGPRCDYRTDYVIADPDCGLPY